jgi:trimeric autotransporter adhesin
MLWNGRHTRALFVRAVVLAATIAAVFTSTPIAFANPPVEPRFVGGVPLLGVNGTVRASLVWDPDGPGPAPECWVIGGTFTVAGDVIAHRVALWDGQKWLPLRTGLGPPADPGFDVQALTLHNGQLVAGGVRVVGTTRTGQVATWNGFRWNTIASFSGDVNALASFSSSLIAGGNFDAPFSHIARWDGTRWLSLGGGTDANVRALTVWNNTLFAAGEFSIAGTAPNTALVAAWNGTSWRSLTTGLQRTGTEFASCLAVIDGELIVGGTFATTNTGFPVGRLAAWNAVSWRSLGWGDTTVIPRDVRKYNSELYMVGAKVDTLFGLTYSPHFARRAGSSWNEVPFSNSGSLVANGEANGLHTLREYRGELHFGGAFRTLSNAIPGYLASRSVARWNGTNYRTLGTAGLTDLVFTVAMDAGRILAAGNNFTWGETFCDGVLWDGERWNPRPFRSGGSTTVAGFWNGLEFSGLDRVEQRNGTTWELLARLRKWQGNQQSTGVAGTALVVGNRLYIGGDFTQSDDGGQGGLVYVDAVARGRTPEAGPLNWIVADLELFNGDLVAVGLVGDFTGPGRIARMRDGSSWQDLTAGANASVLGVAVHNNQLIIVGRFTQLGGRPINRVARLEGSTWQPMGEGFNESPSAVISHDGVLYVGGTFTASGTRPIAGFARWTGTEWVQAGAGVGGGGIIEMASDGNELVIGGSFLIADGRVSASVARLKHFCAGDFNANNTTDFFDYLDFVAALAAEDPTADIDRNGTLDFFDYLDFVIRFDACSS